MEKHNDPSGLQDETMEDAINRADSLSPPDGTHHSGTLCGRKDLRRIVFLVREYRRLAEIVFNKQILAHPERGSITKDIERLKEMKAKVRQD